MAKYKGNLDRNLLELPYEDLKKQLQTIPGLEEQALMCVTYACYGRIGEICKGKSPHSRGMKKNDVQVYEKDGKKYLQFFLYTLKTHETRECFINLQKEEWLAKPILEWINLCTTSYLFGTNQKAYSTRWAEKKFYKHFGTENIHLMRSWRATHAAKGNFTEDGKPLDLRATQIYGGWKNPGILIRIYTKARGKDYLQNL